MVNGGFEDGVIEGVEAGHYSPWPSAGEFGKSRGGKWMLDRRGLVAGLLIALPVEAWPQQRVPEPRRSFIIFFDFGSLELLPRGKQLVHAAADSAKKHNSTRVEVRGFTDSAETDEAPEDLSKNRADVVADLLDDYGVPSDAIKASGFGATRALKATATGTREPENRRVEIVIR